MYREKEEKKKFSLYLGCVNVWQDVKAGRVFKTRRSNGENPKCSQ